MIVGRVVDVDLQPGAKLAGMLVERRLEPALAQPAALHPTGRQRCHFFQEKFRLDLRRAEKLQRPRRSSPLGQGGAFQHHGPSVAARHPGIGRIGARVHPGALTERPAVARRAVRFPSLHFDDAAIDIETKAVHEPLRRLAQREPMSHRQRSCTHETLPARAQPQPLDRTARRVGPVEHADRLAPLGGCFENVAQRREEGVDAAAQILQVDQQHVEAVHHRRGRASDFPVQAEHRDVVHRVGEVGRFDHVVLLVPAQPVLRAERRNQLEVPERRERIQRVHQIARHRRRMREQRHAAARERFSQRAVFQQAVNSELHRVPRRTHRGGESPACRADA